MNSQIPNGTTRVMAEEIFSATKPASSEPSAEARPNIDFNQVCDLIRKLVESRGGTVSQAAVATALRVRWPGETGQYNWFGYSRFSEFFENLGMSDLTIDRRVPGTVRFVKGGLVEWASKIGSGPGNDSLDDVFREIGAPLLEPREFRRAFEAISAAIQKGARTLTDIVRLARDQALETGTRISREKISFLTKGALIGGLEIDRKPMKAARVALSFASSISALCMAKGIQLAPSQEDAVLARLGFDGL